MLRRIFSGRAWLLAISVLVTSPALAIDEVLLTVGSDAPALDVEHWVQDGNGKFKPVTKFVKGKVYVVEFWATWCGPCIQSMPHLAQLQSEYAAKGVQLVSISDEPLETVEKFLEREVPTTPKAKSKSAEETDQPKPEKETQTFKELTSAYCLTTDPDRSSYKDYMEAAVQGGIPTAFIVGKDQKIEWVGHPMSMDEPLAEIVSGKWDRAKFAEEFKPQQERDLMMYKIRVAMQAGDTKSALAVVSKALEKSEGQEAEQLQLLRLQIQLSDKGSEAELPEIVAAAYKKYASQPQLINAIASTLVQKIEGGELKNAKELITLTRPAIEKAAEKGSGDRRASSLDTVAHVQFLAGDVDAAIKTQTQAIEIASPQGKTELKKYLKTLEEAKAKAE